MRWKVTDIHDIHDTIHDIHGIHPKDGSVRGGASVKPWLTHQENMALMC